MVSLRGGDEALLVEQVDGLVLRGRLEGSLDGIGFAFPFCFSGLTAWTGSVLTDETVVHVDSVLGAPVGAPAGL